MDLARLAGCGPAGVLCEIVNDHDGSMSRLPQLQQFATTHGLKMVLISDLVRYRRKREVLVERTASARMPTAGRGRVCPALSRVVHSPPLSHIISA